MASNRPLRKSRYPRIPSRRDQLVGESPLGLPWREKRGSEGTLGSTARALLRNVAKEMAPSRLRGRREGKAKDLQLRHAAIPQLWGDFRYPTPGARTVLLDPGPRQCSFLPRLPE